MHPLRVLIGALALVSLAACGSQSEELEQLEGRVDALEQRVAQIESRGNSARSLQEAQTTLPDSVDDSGPEPPVPSSAEELVVVAQRELAAAAFYGLEDPEFGGTTVVGDESNATIRLYRAGLEDRALVVDLLALLEFNEEVLNAVQSSDGAGEAESRDGTFRATWTASPEELVIELQTG